MNNTYSIKETWLSLDPNLFFLRKIILGGLSLIFASISISVLSLSYQSGKFILFLLLITQTFSARLSKHNLAKNVIEFISYNLLITAYLCLVHQLCSDTILIANKLLVILMALLYSDRQNIYGRSLIYSILFVINGNHPDIDQLILATAVVMITSLLYVSLSLRYSVSSSLLFTDLARRIRKSVFLIPQRLLLAPINSRWMIRSTVKSSYSEKCALYQKVINHKSWTQYTTIVESMSHTVVTLSAYQLILSESLTGMLTKIMDQAYTVSVATNDVEFANGITTLNLHITRFRKDITKQKEYVGYDSLFLVYTMRHCLLELNKIERGLLYDIS